MRVDDHDSNGRGPRVPYICHCIGADQATQRRLDAAATAGCACAGSCDVSTCQCCPFDCAYDDSGRLRAILEPASASNDVMAPIIECGEQCACGPSCRNRVVGHGVRVPLTVFRTNGRGWGVRTCAPLQQGSFVCECTCVSLERWCCCFAFGSNLSDLDLIPLERAPSPPPRRPKLHRQCDRSTSAFQIALPLADALTLSLGSPPRWPSRRGRDHLHG